MEDDFLQQLSKITGNKKLYTPPTDTDALNKAASQLGVNPLDLATVIDYETIGTYNPAIRGGKGGNYTGLIQFGKEEFDEFKVGQNQTFSSQLLNSVVPYFQKRFKKVGRQTQGATLLDLYKTVNGGNPNVSENIRDMNGSIREHVERMQRVNRERAKKRFFGDAPANEPSFLDNLKSITGNIEAQVPQGGFLSDIQKITGGKPTPTNPNTAITQPITEPSALDNLQKDAEVAKQLGQQNPVTAQTISAIQPTNPNQAIAPPISETQPVVAPTILAQEIVATPITNQPIQPKTQQLDAAEYAKYLKYTQKQDSSAERAEFERLSKPEGFSTEVSDVQVAAPKIEIPKTAAREVPKDETNLEVVRGDDGIRKSIAAKVEVDLAQKPQGMSTNAFASRAALEVVKNRYGITDEQIERALQKYGGNILKSDISELTPDEIKSGQTTQSVSFSRGAINELLTGDAQAPLTEVIQKDFDKDWGERQLALQTQIGVTEQPQVIAEAEEKRAEEQTRQELQTDVQNIGKYQIGKIAESAITPFGMVKGLWEQFQSTDKSADEIIEQNVGKVKNQFGSFKNYQDVQRYYNQMDWGETAARMAVNVGRGFVQTVVSDVLKGADFLDSFNERYNPVLTILPENMRPSLRNLGNSLAYTLAYLKDPSEAKNLVLAGINDDIDKKAIYQLGKYIDDSLGKDETLRSRFLGTLSQAAGSGLGFALMGFVAPQLSITTRAGEFALSGAGLGAMQSAGSFYDEGKKSGLSESEARTYGIIGAILGATEGFGIGAAVSKAIKNPEVKRAFLSDFLGFVKQKGKNFATSGAEEALQEFVQSTGGKVALDALKDKEPSAYQKVVNIIERLPKQIGEVVVENLLAAALTGGAMNIAASAAVGDTLVKDEANPVGEITPQEIGKRTEEIIAQNKAKGLQTLGDNEALQKIAEQKKAEIPKTLSTEADKFTTKSSTKLQLKESDLVEVAQTETPKEQKQESAQVKGKQKGEVAQVFEEMGSGLADSGYEHLWQKVQRNDTTELGKPSNILILAKQIREKGGLKTREEFKRFGQDFGETVANQKGQQLQDAASELAQKYTQQPTPIKAEESQKVLKSNDVETGKPVTFNYIRNTEKAPNLGSRFGQDVEPSGKYVIQKEVPLRSKGWEEGQATLKNPLVIDVTDSTLIEWKRDLSNQYGKTGKELTKALQKEGYDGIVTRTDRGDLGEIVLFNEPRNIKEKSLPETAKAPVGEKVKVITEVSDKPTKTVTTERGTKTDVAPKIIEAADLLTSLDEGYPSEYQPRDRSRQASKAQISEIANKLNAEFPSTSHALVLESL